MVKIPNPSPTCCLDCSYYKCCDTSMYTNRCAFFGPEDRPEKKGIKSFFSKFFSK